MVKDCELYDTDTRSEQKYNDKTVSNRRPSTPYSHNTNQKLFSRDPVVRNESFLEVDKTCADIFGIFPRFIKSFMESENWSVVLRTKHKPHWATSSFGSVSRHHFSRHLHTLFTEAEERDALVVSMFPPASPLIYRNVHPSSSIFWCPSRTPPHLTHMGQPMNS